MAIGRNEPCPCGSGKKYKKCCIGKPVAPSSFALADVLPAGPVIPEWETMFNRSQIDPFALKLQSASLDEKLQLLRDKIDHTENLDDLDIIEYLEKVLVDADRLDRAADFESLLRFIEARHPACFSDGCPFDDWRVLDALRSNSELRPALEKFLQNRRDSEIMHEVYDLVRYHGRTAEFAEAIRAHWLEIKQWSQSDLDAAPAIFRAWAMGAIVERYFNANSALQPDDESMLAELSVFRLDKQERLAVIMARHGWWVDEHIAEWTRHKIDSLRSMGAREWSTKTFEGKTMEESDQLLCELCDDFSRELCFQHGWPSSRASMAVDELVAYLRERRTKTRGRVFTRLLPERKTFSDAAAHGANDEMKGRHRQAAFVEAALPWIKFLFDRGLVAQSEIHGLWDSLRDGCSSVPAMLESGTGRDPLMLGRMRDTLASAGPPL